MTNFTLGLDLDGVITRHPDHLRWLSDRILMSGHKVLVITGRMEKEREETLKLLKNLHIRYTELIMYPKDYLFEKGVVTVADMSQIGRWKAQICSEREVGLMLDDNHHWYTNSNFNTPIIHI